MRAPLFGVLLAASRSFKLLHGARLLRTPASRAASRRPLALSWVAVLPARLPRPCAPPYRPLVRLHPPTHSNPHTPFTPFTHHQRPHPHKPVPHPPVPTGKEVQLLRAKALECVSLVGLAVGKERFG